MTAERIVAAIAVLQGNDDAVKGDAAHTLWNLVLDSQWQSPLAIRANKVAIREAGGIPMLVALLERAHSIPEGNFVVLALRELALDEAENKVAILESGAIPLLGARVESDSSLFREHAASVLAALAQDNEACCFAIRDADGIPRLVALVNSELRPHDCRFQLNRARHHALDALRSLCACNAADLVAIALDLGGVEAIVELAREGLVVLSAQEAIRCPWLQAQFAAPGSKRKAALVVAALLRDCVPGFKLAPRDIKMAIGSFF